MNGLDMMTESDRVRYIELLEAKYTEVVQENERLREELRNVCKRALNYSEHVVFSEGVYFDDDDDLPAIRAVLDSLQPNQPGGVG